MTTATTAAKIDEAILLVIAEGECAVPQYNEFGGVDVWTEAQAGYITRNGQTYLAEGVRVVTVDNQIDVIRFEGNQMLANKITVRGEISAELLAQIIKGLI
jgi:hypothetical protein